MSNFGYIYSLCHPVTGEVRYVGRTVRKPETRLSCHLSVAARAERPSHLVNWLRKLSSENLKPSIRVLETAPREYLNELEKEAIKTYRDAGARLVNATDGGDGLLNPSPETREKMRQAKLGKPASDETRAKMSAAHKGRVFSPEHREALSIAALQRTYHSPSSETKAKMRLSARRGSQNSRTKLAEEAVLDIHKRLLSGDKARAIGDAHGVTPENVYSIRDGKTWGHVTGRGGDF